MNSLTSFPVVIDKLAWILLRDRMILMARSRNKDIFHIPGGKREIGQSDGEALTREIREEKLNPLNSWPTGRIYSSLKTLSLQKNHEPSSRY